MSKSLGMVGKWRGLLVVVAEIGLLALPASAQQYAPAANAAPVDRANGPDEELVTRLHQLGQDQIATARLGEERGVRDSVRTFASITAREQAASDDTLVAYAERKGMNRVAVARPGGALEHGALALAPLANSPSNEFDYAFATKVVADQQAAIDAATAAERLARDPELKSLINQVLVTETNHLVSAQALLTQIPTPRPRVVQLPAFPSGVSRTQTGADEPSPAAIEAARAR
jgi:predicted outer membrane protein